MKKYLKIVSFLLLAFLCLILVVVNGFKIINQTKNEVSKHKELIKTLNQKLSILKNVQAELPSDMSFLNMALLRDNALMVVVNNIKQKASSLGIEVVDIKAGQTLVKGGLNQISLTVSIKSDLVKLQQYLTLLDKSLPIITVENITADFATKPEIVNLTISVYSAEPLKTIPSLTEAVKDLTPAEHKLLERISDFSLPELTTLTPQTPSDRINIFEN